MSWLRVTMSHTPASRGPAPQPAGSGDGVGTALCPSEFPVPASLRAASVAGLQLPHSLPLVRPGGQQPLFEDLGVAPQVSSPQSPLAGWGWEGGGCSRLRSPMISCPHPVLTTASCRRQAGRRGGEAGAEPGAGRPGRGVHTGGSCPRFQPRPWPDHPGIQGLPEPALTPTQPSEAKRSGEPSRRVRLAPHQAPSRVCWARHPC